MELSREQRPQLDDTGISKDAPYMRALLAQRYEMVWRACLPHIDGTRERTGESVSAPMIETGVRALRELGRIYRIDNPTANERESVAGTKIGVRELVSGHLDVLEARQKEQF